jgi:tetratricopeptide (TPR) repeat protein
VDGPSLEEWLLDHRPAAAEAEAIFRGILAGVRRAHRHGLVHRDLKPGNVLLDISEDGILPKVTDFGLARILADEDGGGLQTRSGIAMGTPAYMAPEQFLDAKTVDQRAGIFALGAILYELVCGRRPFDGADMAQIFLAASSGRFPAPRSLRPELPDRICATIAGCLAPARERRIPDCDSLARTLDGETRAAVSPSRAPQDRASATIGALTLPPTESAASTLDPAVAAPPPSPGPEPPPRRAWRGAVGAFLLLLTVAAIAAAWWSTRPPGKPYDVHRVSRNSAAQASYEEGVDAFLAWDMQLSERHLIRALELDPDATLARFLHGYVVWDREGQTTTEASWRDALARAAARDREGDEHTRLVQLALRTLREAGEPERLLADWDSYQREHPRDLIACTVVNFLLLDVGSLDDNVARWDRCLAIHDGVVLPWSEKSRVLFRGSRYEAARAVATDGLSRHPATPALLHDLARSETALGNLAAARSAYEALLRRDPGQHGARGDYATVLLWLGDDEARADQVSVLTSATVAPYDRAWFLYEHALALAGRGQLAEAAALSDRCLRTALEAGQPTPRYLCHYGVRTIAPDLGLVDLAAAGIAPVEALLEDLTVPDSERDYFAVGLKIDRASIALAQGLVAEGGAALEQLEALPDAKFAHRPKDVRLAQLRLRVAVAEGRWADAEAAAARLDPCAAAAWLGRVMEGRGDTDGARGQYEQVAAGEALCAAEPAAWHLYAEALVRLARLRLEAGDHPGAQEALGRFRRAWPKADADLPLAIEAARLEAQVAEVEPTPAERGG